MKKWILIIFGLFLAMSCKENKSKVITSDLTFRSVAFSTLYGVTDDKYESMIKELDSFVTYSKKKTEEIALYEHLLKVNDHNLLRLPVIFLNPEKDSVITVYLKESEYHKVSAYKHADLFKEGKKIELKLELKEIDKDIFYSDHIISVKKVTGRSHSNL